MKQVYFLRLLNSPTIRALCCIVAMLMSQILLASPCVNDVTPPIANCHSTLTIQLGSVPVFSIDPSYINNGSTDNCGIDTMYLDKEVLTCADLGTNPIVLTVIDFAGNISTCTTMVTLEDVAPPIASCKNITVQLDASGSVAIAAGDVNDNSLDCNIQSMSIDKPIFTCADLGANTVTLTVVDNNNLSSTCTAIVTVVENELPVALCKDIVLYLDETGNATLNPSDIDDGSSDNCGIQSMSINKAQFVCNDLTSLINPPVPVTLTVIDASSNISTCVANVTVKDTTPPEFTCPADISDTLQASCERYMTLPIPNITEACGGFSIIPMTDNGVVLAVTAGTVTGTFPRGTTTVTYKIDDGFGNWAMCSFTVTLTDVTPPFIPVPVDTFVLPNDPGLCGNIIDVHPCLLPPPATDNCGIESVTLSHQPGDYFPVGNTTITTTATDSSGLVTVETVVVTIVDVEPPMLGCKDFNVFLSNGNNIQTITAADVISNLSDNCGIDSSSITISVDTLDCSSGSQVVTVSVSDIYGNISTCNATVNVIDNENPVAACKDITAYLDNNGNLTITPAMVDNGSTDNCAIASTTIDKTSFDCNHLGQNAVKLKVTDLAGNVDSCYAVVNVVDNIDPDAVCKTVTVQLNANGQATITAADVNNNSTDNCTIASMTVSQTNFDCSHIGVNTVTLIVKDNSGNTATCNATVIVEDPSGGPSVTCQDAIVYLDMMGFANISNSDVIAQSSATCGIASTVISQTAFDCMYVGVNQITVTITDNNGESTNCTANVTVLDTISPVVNCQNINVYLDEDGQANIVAADLNSSSSDNCGIASKTISESNFNCNSIGANNVILTVTDNSGNATSCTGIVTVLDTISPIAKCKNITVQLGANSTTTITSNMVDNGSIDNCAIATMAVTPSTFDCSHVGDQTVTLTVTDVTGNVSTCTSTVTVEDNSTPTITCQNATIYLDGNGNATINESDVVASSTNGNCGTATITLDKTDFTCTDTGINQVIVKIVAGNGQIATCTSTVTVQDTISPIAICRNTTRNLNQNGIVIINANMINDGSSDNCNIASMTIDKTHFTCADIGTNTVTLTVTDDSGNTSICTSTVTIKDNKVPVANCKDITVQLGANGTVSIVGADVNNGSEDNCAIASMTVTPNTFDCGQIGDNTVTLTVTDDNGNVSTCTSTVTVTDNSTPSVSCQDATIYLDNNGAAILTESDVVLTSNNGNCGTITTTLSKTNFDCTNLGDNTVTVIVTSTNGQTASCTATVTVKDDEKPVAICRNMTVQLDNNGQAVVTTTMINNGSTDNCGIATMTVTPNTFDCSNIGANTVTLTVTDASGNAETCTATVTVKDTEDPIAKCQNVTIYLNNLGKAWTHVQSVDNGSTDNCGITKMTLSKKDFNCSHIGANTVTLTVEDASGNTSSCTATVTVKDTRDPIATCKNLVVTLGANGTATITAAMVDNGSTDNCAIATRTIDKSQFTCADVGDNTVTLTVKDASGNAKTCTATVTVKDDEKPVAICRNMTVQLDNNGQAVVTTTMINNGSTDNCGIATMTVTPNTFDCSNIGANTVTLTVTDASGNAETCTATVTVKDTEDPIAKCQNVTIYLNNLGKAWTHVQSVDNGSTDNCGITKMTLSKKDFNCSHIGANTVTLTVEDASGNTASCTATVTVKDAKKPIATCKNLVVTLGTNGTATITAAMVDNGSTDNCAVATRTIDKSQFTCADLGVNTVTLTVKDASGNSKTCTATVTVKSNLSVIPDPVDATCITSSITCTDGNANSIAYAVRLHGITSGAQDYQSNPTNPLKITAYSDGTAQITGGIRLKSNHNYRWDVQVYLKQKMDYPTYQATYNGTAWANGGDPFQTWDYYIMDHAKVNKFTGKGSFINKTLLLKHNPTNYTKAFQIGIAASIYRTTYSVSGWFGFKGSYIGTGDFDFDLDNCTTSGPVSCTDGNPSSAYAVRLHGVAPNKDYKSDPTDPLKFTDLGNGNAIITGTLTNKTVSSEKWKVQVYLKEKMDLATYQANYGGTPWANSGDPTSTWSYYLMDHSKANKFIGQSSFAGKVLNLKHKPTDLKTAFQVGNAASIYRTTYSLSGWFSFTGSYTGTGDFDFDLTNCSPDASCDGIAKVTTKGCGPFTYQWATGSTNAQLDNVCAGSYPVTVTDAGNQTKAVTVVVGGSVDCTPTPPTNGCPALTCGQGKVEVKEYNTGSYSNALSTITNHSSYPNNPSNTYTLTKLEKYSIHAKRGVVIKGYIIPPTTGTYDFYFASDDNGKFLLSTDCDPANKRVIGEVTPTCGWTSYKQWNKCAEQKTLGLALLKDKPYYFEIIVKNGGGAGHFAAGWRKPGNTSITSISGSRIALLDCPTNNCPAVTCGQGSIEAYQYTVGSGNGISTITNHSSYPNSPSNAYVLTKLEKNYLGSGKGLVVKGYIIPPTTGNYDFYFASDDNGKFWLSTDCDKANKELTGVVGSSCGGWTNYKQWTKSTSQRTLNVSLVKDKPYYFEVQVKNGGGSGHFAIGWKKPGSSSITSISGNNLAKYKCATCTSLTNVALNKPTYQSSTGWGGVSSRAVDGNTSGYWSHGSVTHTYKQTNAYWELDLQKIHKIDHIKIWNRKDCCASRLKNYYVLVSNKPFTSGNLSTLLSDPDVWHKYMSSQAGYPSTINVGRTGRYVCVMLKYSNYLTLAEVQVMGCMIGDVLSRTQQETEELIAPVAINSSENTPTEDVTTPPTDEELEITAYPNPFNNKIMVEGFVPEQEEYIDIRILNAQGQEVYREDKIETLGDLKVDISLPNLLNGVYILEATTAQNRKTVKLVRMNNRP